MNNDDILADERIRLDALKNEALGLMKSKVKIADALGVCRQAVYKWFSGGNMKHAHVHGLELLVKMEKKAMAKRLRYLRAPIKHLE